VTGSVLQPEALRGRNRRVALMVVGFMLFLYTLSIVGVIVLN
jgi:hypothetical protein